ncbi:MAG: peptidoglycan DD-metalloendopeptidase family protein [Novosphingobium sp.]
MTSLRALRVPLLLLALTGAGLAVAQQRQAYDDVAQTQRALEEARSQAKAASLRGEKLEAEAARVVEAADRTAQQSAALAARIQQTEAEIAGHQAQIRLIAHQREALRIALTAKQRPLIELTAALQRLSRRPVVFALLRPGSVHDAMHLRAMLATMMPEVERRTAALRGELARFRLLQQQAEAAARSLRASKGELAARRQALAGLETSQRLAARHAAGVADRESENALALAEQARDLTGLVAELGKSAALRDQLALLPGPVMRPPQPERAQPEPVPPPPPVPVLGLARYTLPVDGRLVGGFGDPGSRGIAIAARANAQVVAPGGGRVVFAGPYRGYGKIVIIEHVGGWTSLVTGLFQLDARVGEVLIAGAPLGLAGPGQPVLTLELRHAGTPVDPLQQLRNL